MLRLSIFALLLFLAGCATRPVNPPIAQTDLSSGYTYQARMKNDKNEENLVILAFSGGGTRAAAFSYGVLELLRRTEVVTRNGDKARLLDAVDVITGVSGGSFTALAYGLYGEKLFAEYEQRFLKRDVQGEIIGRALNPVNWSHLSSVGWGRSELAAQLYDDILFDGATFGDLKRNGGPFIMATATDISTGGRVVFTQNIFNVFCSDLEEVRLSRAAAASSAVPVVLSSVTFNNYGGTCGWQIPPWATRFLNSQDPPRPAARVVRGLNDAHTYSNSQRRPYIHLVDGGIADNVGMRGVLDAVQLLEALHGEGIETPLDRVKRIVVFVVNSLSSPPTTWDEVETAPGTFDVLIKSAGVPIDHYSYEAVELLKDISARWRTSRRVRELAGCAANADAPICKEVRVPGAEIYAIDVSFARLNDNAERAFLNQQPTSFVLTPEGVDRLRAAAGAIIQSSPEFQRLLKDVGARIVDPSSSTAMK